MTEQAKNEEHIDLERLLEAASKSGNRINNRIEQLARSIVSVPEVSIESVPMDQDLVKILMRTLDLTDSILEILKEASKTPTMIATLEE